MSRKRLVLMVEGHGDAEATCVLVKRLLAQQAAFDVIILDEFPIRVGGYSKVCKNQFADWHRYLKVAKTRKDFGAALLLLDGDSDFLWDGRGPVEGEDFCAMRAARMLAKEAQRVGAGSQFSVAVVFACKEFESWFIAAADSLVGKRFPDGRIVVSKLPQEIPADPETSPRDAKGWIRQKIPTGYNPPRDQAKLAELVDLSLVRQKMRSFRRLEAAVHDLVEAVRMGQAVCTP
ncbi:MAG TPA: DUF4276 family protein [Thermoguttaceae bacterium]|nr:DUF4276 family protein [Thermoguttaceae bacterium]HPP51767.1 DUF4276 family protein [Thermoguttaceae bacterium]